MGVYNKLLEVQVKLKAPKSQYNSFGKYNYRNCEDILEAAKPHLNSVNAVILLSDSVELVGERYYVKATATFIDCEDPTQSVCVTASAREEDNKKGMDASQVTGAASSYARKYALNGLLDIDDTKDSDTTNTGAYITQSIKETKPKPKAHPVEKQTEFISTEQAKEIIKLTQSKWGMNAEDMFKSVTGYDSTKHVPAFAFPRVVEMLKEAENYE